MSTVVKIGGALLENPTAATAAIQKIVNGPTAIVHGGGVQISRMLDQMNVPTRFVDGLRVTDERTLRAASLALLGEVHAGLVQALSAAGVPAIGLFGSVRASLKEGPWGFVGTNVAADPEVLLGLLSLKRMPVIPTLALGADSLLNVNGDETAAAVAVRIQAGRLIFMTDVPGVLDANGALIESVKDVDGLLEEPFVSGGMLPKLRAVRTALHGGVRVVQVGRTVFEAVS